MTPSSPADPPPYKTTLFDRQGPAAADTVRAFAYGLMVFGIATSAWLLNLGHLSLGVLAVFAMMGAVVGGASLALSVGAGTGWNRVMASGTSTPYEEQFSYQDSLVMRGLVDDALASYEAIIAEHATAVTARLRAAALYASRGDNPQRAAELLREARLIPGVAAHDDISATNRLIELMMGPLHEPGRAMVELRRLMDRHPDTVTAARAKLVLAELKEEMARREE